jgi:hypothetical protein
MQPISTKKIGILILFILVLSRLDIVINLIHRIYGLFAEWLSPLRNTPPSGQVALAALLLALIYITIFKIILERIKKK